MGQSDCVMLNLTWDILVLWLASRRLESAATIPYPRGGELPAQMDASTAVYAQDEAPFGDMDHPWASEDGPKSMKENHGEDAVNTELKI